MAPAETVVATGAAGQRDRRSVGMDGSFIEALRPGRTSIITYILVYEREHGLIRD